MSKYELIAFDMDGTLLNSKKEIAQNSIKMIEKAVSAGKYVILNTGRGVAELLDYIKFIPGLRYLNCTSGAMVYDWMEQKVIYSNPLMPDEVYALLKIAKEENVMVHFLTKESFVQRDQWEKMEYYCMGIYKEMFRRVAKKEKDIYEFYAKNPFPVSKLNLYHDSKESRVRTEKKIKQAGLKVSMVYSEEASLEISAKGVDKGVGLRKLGEYLNIPMESIIAVGDSDNDFCALQTAGLGIAMENANEKIKRIADVIVADCDHDGCAEAIETYLL